MLIQIENGLPRGGVISETEFCRRFPNVSFPTGLEGVDPSDYGYAWYLTASRPVPSRYENVEEGAPENVDYATWRQTWVLSPMSPQERAEVDAEQARIMVNQRNTMLFACDWTQLPDSPVDGQTWQAYRQALRDVPSQPGFPWNIAWPTSPAETPKPNKTS